MASSPEKATAAVCKPAMSHRPESEPHRPEPLALPFLGEVGISAAWQNCQAPKPFLLRCYGHLRFPLLWLRLRPGEGQPFKTASSTLELQR